MNVIEQLIENLKKYDEESQEKAILNIVSEYTSSLLDENLDQLFHGRDSQGIFLREYSSDRYAAFKKTLNPNGVTDLKLTGAFYQGFFADTSAFPIKISSNDEKAELLEGSYGEDIYGLDEVHLESFRQTILSDVQDYYSKMVQL